MKKIEELRAERAELNKALPGLYYKEGDGYSKAVRRIHEINEEIHGRTTTRINGIDFPNGAVESGELEL